VPYHPVCKPPALPPSQLQPDGRRHVRRRRAIVVLKSLHVEPIRMIPRRRKFNPKRRLCPSPSLQARQTALAPRIGKVQYGGNPEHKLNPGDFGLAPPANPRPNKTLCDQVNIFTRAEALSLLKAGFQHGTFSEQERSGWPQNVWAVTNGGQPLEAQLEGNGVYHGYPMPEADPLRDEVLKRWRDS
jgi:hypothetical protein